MLCCAVWLLELSHLRLIQVGVVCAIASLDNVCRMLGLDWLAGGLVGDWGVGVFIIHSWLAWRCGARSMVTKGGGCRKVGQDRQGRR